MTGRLKGSIAGRLLPAIAVSVIVLVCLLFFFPPGYSAPPVSGVVVPLSGNHPVQLENTPNAPAVAPTRPLRMQIFLKFRDPGAVDRLIAEQQDPRSPNYRHWLSNHEIAERFGPSQGQFDRVQSWLVANGFAIESANRDARTLIFDGTAAQAESAFRVRIVTSPDAFRFGNIGDPQIPAEFQETIERIGGLDNFTEEVPLSRNAPAPKATPVAHPPNQIQLPSTQGSGQSSNSGKQPVVVNGKGPAFGPADLYAFYDENTLLARNVNGSGTDCIAIVGNSDFLTSSRSLFTTTFNIAPSNFTRVIVDDTNPGIGSGEGEAELDMDWAHAVAPGSQILFYLGNSQTAVNGAVVDATFRTIADNLCGTISVSFGICPSGGNSFFTGMWNTMLQTAAMHGQSVFISSGDDGVEGLGVVNGKCTADGMRAIDETSGSPNVTSVGGTQFTPNFDSNNLEFGFVAEQVWQDMGGASGGGASMLFAKPTYQSGPGVPTDGARDIPDIAMIASAGSPGVFIGGDNMGAAQIQCCSGGTSLSAPIWAGISKLVERLAGARIGNLNPMIYQLGRGAATASNAAPAFGNLSPACYGLRDVTSGNNGFAGLQGYNAGKGFDLASGWGSGDIADFAYAFIGKINSPNNGINSQTDFTNGLMTVNGTASPFVTTFGTTTGPDGDIWFADYNNSAIGTIRPNGNVVEFPDPNQNSTPSSITSGPDGNLWFTETESGAIGRITPKGEIQEFPIPVTNPNAVKSSPIAITAGPDGKLWFTDAPQIQISSIDTSGNFQHFDIPPIPQCAKSSCCNGYLQGITTGADGNLWFIDTAYNPFFPNDPNCHIGYVGKATTAGSIEEFAIPVTSGNSTPVAITSGPDGNLWFTDVGQNALGTTTEAGQITEFPMPVDFDTNFTAVAYPAGISPGPDGNLWITEKTGLTRYDGSSFTAFTTPFEVGSVTKGPACALSMISASGFSAATLVTSPQLPPPVPTPAPTPTAGPPTPTPTEQASETPTETPSASPTSTFVSTPTRTGTAKSTPSPTPTPIQGRTATPTLTSTPTVTATPQGSPTPTASPTPILLPITPTVKLPKFPPAKLGRYSKALITIANHNKSKLTLTFGKPLADVTNQMPPTSPLVIGFPGQGSGIAPGTCITTYAGSLPANKSCTVTMVFAPLTRSTTYTATVNIFDNGGTGTQTLTATGTSKK